MLRALLTASFICASLAAHAQVVTLIKIDETGTDSVGRRLVYFVKEGVARSATMDVYYGDDRPHMGLKIVTLDHDQSPGQATVYSLVVTMKTSADSLSYFITQYVGYCGSHRVQQCAENIVANVAQQRDQLLSLLSQPAPGARTPPARRGGQRF